MRKKPINLLILLGANLVLLWCVLFSFEAVLKLRQKHKNLPFNGIVSGKRYTWGHEIAVNSRGFREREFVLPKPAGVTRIVVLGDSLTNGVGVGADERYTDVAERLLSAHNHGKIEVLNFGMDGAPTVFERDVFHSWKSVIGADRIVVGFCVNDTQPREQDFSVEKQSFDRRARFVLRPLFKTLRFFNFNNVADRVKKGIYGFAETAGVMPSWMDALDRTYNTASPEWAAFVAALADIKKDSDDLKLPPPIFLVLNQGVYLDKPTDYTHPDARLMRYLAWYGQAEAAAKAAGFVTGNVAEEIARRLPNRILAVNEEDLHPGKELHQLYAEKLVELLERKHL